MAQDRPAPPRHVAIVMDGNGRWAKKRFLPRFFGHKAGVDSLVKVVQACIDRGIEHVTVFAFSSENWKRPSDEVSGLMGLVLAAVMCSASFHACCSFADTASRSPMTRTRTPIPSSFFR